MSPEAGKIFSYDSAFDGRVEEVTEKEVDVRLLPKEGAVVKTPFGEGHIISEDADSYKIDIDARVGSLVRSAYLIGRITDVDDKTMTIDYRNPFGGETLFCDVTVQDIAEIEVSKEKTLEK
jgi:FKBP-type peptidyl-prolyl cis-trans isomerase 2